MELISFASAVISAGPLTSTRLDKSSATRTKLVSARNRSNGRNACPPKSHPIAADKSVANRPTRSSAFLKSERAVMSRSSDMAATTVTASTNLPAGPPPSNIPDEELGIGRRTVALARQVVLLSCASKKPAVLGIKMSGKPSLSTTTS